MLSRDRLRPINRLCWWGLTTALCAPPHLTRHTCRKGPGCTKNTWLPVYTSARCLSNAVRGIVHFIAIAKAAPSFSTRTILPSPTKWTGRAACFPWTRMMKVTGVCCGIIAALFTKSPSMLTFLLIVSTSVTELEAQTVMYTGHSTWKRRCCRSCWLSLSGGSSQSVARKAKSPPIYFHTAALPYPLSLIPMHTDSISWKCFNSGFRG